MKLHFGPRVNSNQVKATQSGSLQLQHVCNDDR